jgi:hypothetical protein
MGMGLTRSAASSPDLQEESKAPLRVNLEQTPALMPGSRRVDLN